MLQPVTLGKRGFFATLRRDKWWVEPALVAFGLSAFGVYATVSAVLWDSNFEVGPYLSPLYEPLLVFEWWKFSPALLILWVPLGFRGTCYYYRGAYYKAFFANPPACAVTGFENKKFGGEAKFPMTVMHLHRFFLYIALIFNVFLWWGAFNSLRYDGEWGLGLGSVILFINAFLLMMYSLSCHSLRHIIGGKLDCFSCSASTKARKGMWDKVTHWNENHRLWAWSSLIWVGWTDAYIRLVANGVITDPNTWGILQVIH